MRFHIPLLLIAGCCLLIAGCDSYVPTSSTTSDAQAQQAPPVPGNQAATNFVAPASGDQEVPPVDTNARGNTTFQLRADGLHFRLTVANLENLTAAHIHCGEAGVNGRVVVWLYGLEPGQDPIAGHFSGVLATGVIAEADVIPEPIVNPCPGLTINDFDDLLTAMREGEAYVNVHTVEHPPGEIRGQIRPAGRR